ncbi:hypothetical protein HID58_042987 [Brassica napus]|uniref:Replication protein A 70 kDa DNA-binding subunit B/D first OB fold domain-containing protein n=2 Tax=Brassica napus TaxID=3708 RepID=A0ABQ8BF71_BRANA|nr:hypothetical protein HID58_042987 [Brassica napus]
MAMKSAVKSQLTTGKAPLAMYFNDISPGLSESQLRFRVIHFWEAKNIANGTLIGIELLLIDEHGTVMQGFISSSRAPTYLPHLKAGAIYTLQNFLAATSKEIYRVADQNLNTFILERLCSCSSRRHPRLRLFSNRQFSNCVLILIGASLLIFIYNVLDVVGHLRLVNGQSLIDRPVLDEAEVISTRRILVHLQSKDGPVMKLYLWDQTAKDFYKKFTSSEDTPTVLLVTTVNPKVIAESIRLRSFAVVTCNLALSSMASSRVFIDKDIQPTIDYFSWLGSNPEIAKRVNADEVTRSETMTIGQIYAYIKQENAKEASFDCIATIDDVKRDSAWYYIGCSGCQTKATRGPSSLMCAKCGKTNVSGVAKYLAKISVYEKMTRLFLSYLVMQEANQDLGAGHQMPVPQALIDTIGQTHKFRVNVSKLNLTGKIQAITVTKIVSPEVLPPVPLISYMLSGRPFYFSLS